MWPKNRKTWANVPQLEKGTKKPALSSAGFK